jgi:phosphoribosylglycinamide formyltransferase-1
MLRLACLASGGGSTVAAILDAIKSGHLPNVTVPLIITNKEDAGVIEKARVRGYGLDVVTLVKRNWYDSDKDFGDAIVNHCKNKSVDIIGQYGWLPKTSIAVIDAYRGMIVNQHPGPLCPGQTGPDGERLDFGGKGMYGRRVIAAALYFARESKRLWHTKATAHLVTEEYDAGDVIRDWRVPIESYDTVETLQKKLLPAEHMLQISILGDFASYGLFPTCAAAGRYGPLLDTEIAMLNQAKESAIRDYPAG